MKNKKFQMIVADRIVGLLGKVASPFQPTTRNGGGDCTTTMRRRDVGAATPTFVTHVVASLGQALIYDNYLCLVASNK